MNNLDKIDKKVFEKILTVIPSCIFFKDTELKYVFSTHYWEQLNAEGDSFNIYGKTDLEIRKDKENAILAMKMDKQIIKTGIGCEYTIKTEIDDNIQYLQLKKEPIKDDDGNVIGIVGLINDVTKETILKNELEFLSTHDTLTNLRNRQSGTELIEKELNENSDESHYFCVMDIDDFKHINDTYGHKVGDDVLKSLAKAIESQLENGDIACRIGGDEFVVLFKGSYNKINEKIKNISKIKISAIDESVRISIGKVKAIKGHSFNILYMRADSEMYRTKKERKIIISETNILD